MQKPALFCYFAVAKQNNNNYGKSTHFFGQPVYGQLIKSLNREKILKLSRKNNGEKYVKSFDGFTHLLTMLYAVIMRFDSLRETEAAMTAEIRKSHHVGINKVPKRSTLSDANARRPEKFFEEVYMDLYHSSGEKLSSDSRRNGTEQWIDKAEFPVEILLWGKRKRHKDTNTGYINCKPSAFRFSKFIRATVELLGTCNNE